MDLITESYKVLGTGRYGEVRLISTANGNNYALKINNKYPNLKSVEYEKYLLKNLGLLHDYYIDQDTNQACFVMSHIPGVPLTDYKENPIPFKSLLSALHGGLSLIEQLGKIHNLGFIHNDLKYSNIIYDESPSKITLIDFGGALPIGTKWRPLGFDGEIAHNLAPEIDKAFKYKKQVKANFAMDVYSLGIVFRNYFDVIHGIPIIKKLINEMLHPAPKSRPDLNTIYNVWNHCVTLCLNKGMCLS